MLRRRIFILFFALLTTVTLALSGPIDDLVNQVSQTQYTHYLSDPNFLYTHNGNTRAMWEPQQPLARTNILNTLTSFGLSAALDPFVFGGNTFYNVVAVKPGAVTPNTYYIVGAHYDSVMTPGGDDNASGVAGVLEAARVLSQYTFQSTLVFIAFNAEENGLFGSQAYANAHAADNIAGMISMDMVAFNDSVSVPSRLNTAWIDGRPASDPVKQALAAAITAYGGGITPLIGGTIDASDHAPFEWVGKQAALLIEGAMTWGSFSNPYYHQVTDSVDSFYGGLPYIDYQYATNMTRAVTGYLATAAVLSEGQAAVPEPSCLVLLIIAGAVRLTRRRNSSGSRVPR